MLISESLGRLKIWLVPVLFSVAAVAVFAGHVIVTRSKEASKRAIQIKIAEDPFAAETAASGALRDLYVAARKGDVAARLELAKKYADGVGVIKNEARAFSYFRAIADQYAQTDPRGSLAPQVSEAFRYLARFYRKGIAVANVKPDPSSAANLLHYAASYFGDSASQFELAKLMLEGKGVAKNPKIATQWLQNARRKGYVPAQALLGYVLWRGEGVQRLPGEGLGLLAVARMTAPSEHREWVEQLYETARAQATTNDILEANAFIALERSANHAALTNDILIKSEPQARVSGAASVTATTTVAVSTSAPANPALAVNPASASATSTDKNNASVPLEASALPATERRFFNIRASVAKNEELEAKPAAPLRYGPTKETGQSQ